MPEETQTENTAVPVVVNPDQIAQFTTDVAAKATEQVMRDLAAKATPELMRSLGIANANDVAAPAIFVKNLPHNPYENFTEDFRGLAFIRAARMKAIVDSQQSQRGIVESTTADFTKAIGGRYGEACVKVFEALSSTKAIPLNATDDGIGFLRESYGDFLAYLRPYAIVMQSGAIITPMPGGSLTHQRQTSPTQAQYVKELMVPTPTKIGTGADTLTAHKMIAIAPISNSLLRWGGPEVDVRTRNDLALSGALRMDLAGIRGSGALNTPRGARYWIQSANVFAATGTTLAAVIADSNKAIRLTKDNNIPQVGFVWWMSPRTEMGLKSLLNSFGVPVFRDEMNAGKWQGLPYYASSQIPDNLGSGGDSEIYLVAMPQFEICMTYDTTITVLPPGSAYNDGTGNIIATASTDETVMQLIGEHDFYLRYAGAGAIITGVTIS